MHLIRLRKLSDVRSSECSTKSNLFAFVSESKQLLPLVQQPKTTTTKEICLLFSHSCVWSSIHPIDSLGCCFVCESLCLRRRTPGDPPRERHTNHSPAAHLIDSPAVASSYRIGRASEEAKKMVLRAAHFRLSGLRPLSCCAGLRRRSRRGSERLLEVQSIRVVNELTGRLHCVALAEKPRGSIKSISERRVCLPREQPRRRPDIGRQTNDRQQFQQ